MIRDKARSRDWRASGAGRLATAGAVAAALIGLGFALGALVSRRDAARPPTPPPPAARVSVWLVPDAARAPTADASPREPAAGTGGRGCPEGTQEFEAAEFGFGEPYPREWLPSPRPTGLRAEVEAFCVDRRAATVGDFARLGVERRAARSGHAFAATGCNATTAVDAAANCVAHDEAEQFCNLRGLRLPRLTEWEAVARAETHGRVALVGNTSEWTEDPFPSPAWNRGLPQRCGGAGGCFLVRGTLLAAGVAPGEGARYSWSRRPAEQWAGDIGVRCAWAREGGR